MSYMVSGAEKKEINFQPENIVEEVLQNVWFILNTMECDCPLDRELGLNIEFMDKSIEAAIALSVAEIFEKIELYEPRAEVLEVTFETNHVNGSVYAKAEVNINDDYDGEEDTE